MIKEFRDFALKGNMLDMAVGVIIGAAFGKIVGSLVEDVIMPPIGLALGKVDFSNLFISLSGTEYASVAAAKAAGAATLNYGIFFNTILNFFIVALAIFLIIRRFNAMEKPQTAPAPSTKDCPYCLSAVPMKATRCGHCTSNLQ